MDDFRAVVRSSPDLYLLLTPELRIVEASDAFLRATDTSRQDALGREVFEIFPEDPAEAVADGVTHLRASLQRAIRDRVPSPMPVQRHPIRVASRAEETGAERFWEPLTTPVLDDDGRVLYVIYRAVDVTEAVRLRREKLDARLNAERLRSAVESIQDAFALFDADDRLVMCNSVFLAMVHSATPESIVGKSYVDILDAWIDDIDFPDEAARERFREERIVRRQTDPTVTFDVHMKDGRALRILDRRTAEGGVVKTIWDLTEDEHRAAELREARVAAESASAAKSEFLSSMSHELRTPLNAILGFAQLLVRDRREPLVPRHKDRVEHILSGGEHLLRLIDDVLDLSKIEAGRISLSPEPVAVSSVVAEVARALEPIAERQNVVLEVAPLPDVPMVIADRTRFVQILMNFGSNAIKYNRRGGRARMTVSSNGEAVRVTISDTGLGIPVDKQDKMFQPFQRAGQETGPIEGTGIGLAITKRLADLMHGSVGFESVSGEGSAFWVELPIDRQDELGARRARLEERRVDLRPRSGSSKDLVLCVEDNPANVAFMRDLVGTLGDFELVTVPTAELGIAFARARRPALVLMDINLPGMSGLDALKMLRSEEETRSIPVIALTAAASERDRERGMKAGFFRYLSKPVNVDELVSAIDAILGRGPASKQ